MTWPSEDKTASSRCVSVSALAVKLAPAGQTSWLAVMSTAAQTNLRQDLMYLCHLRALAHEKLSVLAVQGKSKRVFLLAAFRPWLATETHIATAARHKHNVIFSTYVGSWPVLPGERFKCEKHHHHSQHSVSAVSRGHSFCPESSQNSISVRQPGH